MTEKEVSETGFLGRISIGNEVGPAGDLHGGPSVFPARECLAICTLPLGGATTWQHTEL